MTKWSACYLAFLGLELVEGPAHPGHMCSALAPVPGALAAAAPAIQGTNVASDYTGLESVAVGLSQITGLSLFVSGLVLVGMARLIMMLALYRFGELVTGSSRAAAAVPLIFAASGNYLFWSAQFSYESLALPLFVTALVIVVARGQHGQRRASDIALLLVGAALIATHHLTSYALAALLWVVSAMALRRPWRSYRVIGPAVALTVGAAAWFAFVATGTRAYLSYIFRRTTDSIQQVISSGGGRVPFQSSGPSSTALQTPLPEQVVSYLTVLILGVGVVAVLVRYKRTGIRVSPGSLIAAGAALGFLALYPMRVAPGAWETANRGQEFFFFGAATVLSVACLFLLGPGQATRWRTPLVGGLVVFVISGGVIAGWPSPLRLPPPLRVAVDHRVIVPEGLSAATWALNRLGRENVFVGDEATGREIAVGGARFTYLGSADGVPQLLQDPTFQPWELQFIRLDRIDYVIVDRRQLSTDNLGGYYFQPASQPDGGRGYFPAAASRKFAALPMVSTVFDSGDIQIYDVRGLWATPPPCSEVDLYRRAYAVTCSRAAAVVSKAGASNAVTFPKWRVRYLGTDVVPNGGSATVSVRIQVQNLTRARQALNTDPRHIYLEVAHTRLPRLAHVPLRRDNLVGTYRIPADGHIEGSVSFTVSSPRLVADVLRSGVNLFVRLNGPAKSAGTPGAEVALIATDSRRGSVR